MKSLRFTRRQAIAAGAAAGALALLPKSARTQTAMRWAENQAASHPSAQMIERVAKEVKEKTSGRIDVLGFPGGQLGGSRDVVEAVSSGAITMTTEGAALLGQFVPQLSIIEAPYLWTDAAHMARALNSPLLEELNKLLVERRGLRMIGVTYYGKRHVTTRDKAVRVVDDMRGFKLRVPEVDTFRAMAEAWGARATPLNFNELYLALSQGAVDGQENPLPTIASGKLNEVQKYLVLTGHIVTPRLVIVNERAWTAIPEEDRAVIRAAVKAGAEWQDKEIAAQEASLVDTFKKGGMTVIEPDVESFRKPVLASLPQKFESKWGKGLWERVQSL